MMTQSALQRLVAKDLSDVASLSGATQREKRGAVELGRRTS